MIKRGMRVRLLVPLMLSGYKGPCTVLHDHCGDDGSVIILPDTKNELRRKSACARHEVSIMRDQTPNEIHEKLLREGDSASDYGSFQ